MAESSTENVVPCSFKLEKSETITKVLVKHGFVVDGIGFQISDEHGNIIDTIWFTGTGGKSPNTDEVPLVDDFLTHISGTYGTHQREKCITTMRIHTDLCPEGFGPYGEPKEPSEVTPFSSPLPIDGSIVGFFGCTEKFLGSIGIYASGKKITKFGPYGDIESKVNWYIKLKEGDKVSKVIIKDAFLVDGIGFEVKNNITGKAYTQEFSGPEEKTNTITLEEDEVITKITGSSGEYDDKGIKIATIMIYTNLHQEGIGYGREDECTDIKPFSYQVTPKSSIVGFYGSYGTFLNSIGFSEEFEENYNYGPYGRIL